MDTAELHDLRRALSQRNPGNGHATAELRARATAYLRRRRREGASVAAIAAELGLCYETARRWLARRAPATVRPVPVRIVEAAAAAPPARTVTVVSPGGFHVDGLSLDEAAALLRALR